jgi:tetratricopeptide (TPR) repeat protein
MLLSLASMMLVAALQSTPPDRAQAERLARAGETAEALALFERIAELNPADLDARVWVARLTLRLGRTAEAEAGFRSVLRDAPTNIEAQIGLGTALTQTGDWRAALDVLQQAEQQGGGLNADLLPALARAYRHAGHDRRAFQYFDRARRLAPDDPDVTAGYEATLRTYGHWIAAAGLGQWSETSSNYGSGELAGDLRALTRLHFQGIVRGQKGSGYSDTIAGAGAVWQASNSTDVSFRAIAGSDNHALANADLLANFYHYAGLVEFGTEGRRMVFQDAQVAGISALSALNPNDNWRTDFRYTYSHSTFADLRKSTSDHSVMVRETWQLWRRVALQGMYAYGIENFDELTADRLASPNATTVAVGTRIDLRSVTRVTTTWEHQWRSNDSTIDRVAVAVVQYLR